MCNAPAQDLPMECFEDRSRMGFFRVPYRCHGMSNYGGLRFKLIPEPGKNPEGVFSTSVSLSKLLQLSEPSYISQAKFLEDGTALCVESP